MKRCGQSSNFTAVFPRGMKAPIHSQAGNYVNECSEDVSSVDGSCLVALGNCVAGSDRWECLNRLVDFTCLIFLRQYPQSRH